MRLAALTALCLCLPPAIPAQEKPKSAHATALDKTQLETYVRHLLAVIPEVQVKIDDPKPTSAADLLQVDVHFSYQGRTQEETFYITKNGQNIIRGVVYNFAQNPFQEDLDKLKTGGSPSFGADSAPVTVVEFGDFECPNCKEEAKTLRANLPTQFPTQVRVFFKDFPLEQIHPWAKAGGHRWPMRLSAEPGCVLEVSRLDLRASDRDSARQSESQGNGFRQDRPGSRRLATRPLHRYQGHRSRSGRIHGRRPLAARGRHPDYLFERPPPGWQLSLAEHRSRSSMAS